MPSAALLFAERRCRAALSIKERNPRAGVVTATSGEDNSKAGLVALPSVGASCFRRYCSSAYCRRFHTYDACCPRQPYPLRQADISTPRECYPTHCIEGGLLHHSCAQSFPTDIDHATFSMFPAENSRRVALGVVASPRCAGVTGTVFDVNHIVRGMSLLTPRPHRPSP